MEVRIMRRRLYSFVVACVLLAAAGDALMGSANAQCVDIKPGDQTAGPAASSYSGIKKRLAVLRLDNKVKTPLPDASWQIGEGLTEMLTTELFRTGRYTMVERAALSDVVKEQELGQTGLVNRATATKVGELLGAQLLVTGAVTEFEATAGGGGTGFGFGGFALALKTNAAHVAVDIRLVDSTNGQILKSFSAAGKAQESGLAFAGNVRGTQFGSDAYQKTPLGQATREAVAKAVNFICSEMDRVAWTGRVVQVKERDVYVNAGANMNLNPGLALEAFVKGEELIDPSTGLNLGSRDAFAGVVTLNQVEEKFSIGTFEGNGSLKRGDILKMK
jgi:curli biogenesis system outer membrane secretion channel CsgG